MVHVAHTVLRQYLEPASGVRRFLVLSCVVGLLQAASFAEEPSRAPAAKGGTTSSADFFLLDPQARNAVVAAAVVGAGPSLSGEVPPGLALLNASWPQEPAVPEPEGERNTDRARALRASVLAGVIDGRDIPSALDKRKNAEDEHFAYTYALYEASRTPAEAFAKSARPDLKYPHWFHETSKYRGEVVHVEGRLKRLLRYDPPLEAAQAGVKDLYEGWIFAAISGADPTCVVFTDLPPGMSTGEKVEYQVSFDGYLFKRYRYKAADNLKANEWREAPLLIGRTLVWKAPPAAEAETGWAEQLVPAFVGLVLLTVATVVGLSWWMRRGDRQVRSRLAGARAPTFVEPAPEPEVPFATPVTEPAPPRETTG